MDEQKDVLGELKQKIADSQHEREIADKKGAALVGFFAPALVPSCLFAIL